MKWKILVSAPYFHRVLDEYAPRFAAHDMEMLVPPVRERLEEDELLALTGDVDGAICGDDRFTRRVLEASPRLKVISKWGTGIDSIDQEACRDLGIAVRNTPDAFTDAVADQCLAFMLAFARRLPWVDRRMKAGDWEKEVTVTLGERRLGIVGLGRIGQAVALRARAFGMAVFAVDPRRPDASFFESCPVVMGSMEEILPQVDFLSVNCDLNPTSRRLVDERALDLLPPGAVLINTARGPIVHQEALLRALERGRLGGAALDVFEDEPLPVDHPLRSRDDVILSPHAANGSPRAWERVHRLTFQNLLEELERSAS